MSIIIAILAMLVAGLIPGKTTQRELTLAKQEEARLDTITAAIRAYYDKRSYLPCPAVMTASLNSATFGISGTCSGAAPAGITEYRNLTVPGVVNNDEIWIGALPTRSLSLPDSYAMDSWGSRYTYAVVKKLGNSTDYSGYTTTLTNGIIQVTSAGTGATQLTPASESVIVAFIIVSHGPDKKGGYRKNTTAAAPFNTPPVACGAVAAALDNENCNNDDIFVDAPITETSGATYFNDFVRWRQMGYYY